MPLVPSKDDPNRASELKRMRSNPLDFGADTVAPRPLDWTPNALKSGIVESNTIKNVVNNKPLKTEKK